MSVTLDTTLLGPVDCSVSQIVAAVKWSSTATAYDEATVAKIALSIVEWSRVFGYRTSALASQILHETGKFRYGGQVKPDQWNFAGLGSTNDGAAGAKFAGISDGVLAVCCHRALYQFGDVPDWPQHLKHLGPRAIRRDAVKSAGYLGTVQTIGQFTNGKWAWSPQYPKGSLENGYAAAIARGANEILAYPDTTPKEEPVADLTSRVLAIAKERGVEVHDIRGRLPTDGRYATKGTNWEHVAVHYTGVWRERNTLEKEIASWMGHANYHVNTHGWPGIAYALGISASGRLFGLRDAELIGYHAFNANSIALGISNDLTDGQVPPPEMKRTLNVVLRALDEVLPNYVPARTWGHKELAWYDNRNRDTLCPGRFLTPLVQQFRTGKDFALELPAQTVPIQPDHAKIQVAGVGTFWIIGNIFKAWSSVRDNILIYGYPLTPMYEESGDKVQYFERAVMRWKGEGYWPDNFDVDFEAVGRFVHDKRYGKGHAPAQPIPYFSDVYDRVWMPATQHSMSKGFLAFWRQNGDVKVFGFPITEEFEEGGRTVQYFERARFEHHPNSNPRWYDTMLGRLGSETLFIRQSNPVLVEEVAA